MITEIEDFFAKGCGRCPRFDTDACSTRKWRDGLARLRAICLSAGLEEKVKWGHPCYMHADRNIALIGAFQNNFRLSFFNAALLKDADGVLEKPGPNTQNPNMICFTSNDGPNKLKRTILSYLDEAKGYAECGLKPPQVQNAPELPAELVEALDADSELAEAFHALTPGRRKSYVFNLNQAKKPETRIGRIEKFRDKIIAGKGAMER
ncbi:MAG: YdeI/OmpD-associated family protein [Parvularculaceae bacterium]|nr:YdeI/OmpD-associated family protein [Parvularculaceae bacterium]